MHLWEETDLSEILTMEAEGGIVRKKNLQKLPFRLISQRMLLWIIVYRLSFFRKNNLSTYIFGSSHPEVFSKKVLNILAKSLKYACGGYFVIKLQFVICIYSTNELLYRHFSGSFRLYLNFIISMYPSFAPSISLEKTCLVLIWFSANPTFQTLYKKLLFSMARFLFCFCFFETLHFQVFIERELTLSWQRPLSYRNQSIDLHSKSMNRFLYDNGLRHERAKLKFWMISDICSVGILMLILLDL